jgi:CRISPR-associated protein Csm3
MRLKDYLTLRGTLCCVTGLRIGGAAETIEIGGLDNPVIKHPITNLPYVPGSSLKGKMRSLLEFRHNKVPSSGEVHVCSDKECLICRIFGTSASESEGGPGRLILRDAELTGDEKDANGTVVREGWKSKAQKLLDAGQPITEIKYENTINRIKSSANPRQMERVPAGVEFAFEIGYRVFDTGDGGKKDWEFFQHVVEGLKLVQADALGSSGSRGYGRVAFENMTVTNLAGEKLVKAETLDELTLPDLPEKPSTDKNTPEEQPSTDAGSVEESQDTDLP